MFSQARVLDPMRPKWQRTAAPRGAHAIDVSWSKKERIASKSASTDTSSPQRRRLEPGASRCATVDSPPGFSCVCLNLYGWAVIGGRLFPRRCLRLSTRRISLLCLTAVLCALPFVAPSTAAGAIAPPWCGTPMPDGTAALPDGSSPTHPVGSYPHIPWYAIGCTLERIQSESNGRMTYRVTGQSALGFDLYAVTINALNTKQQRKDFRNWKKIRKDALDRPDKAQKTLARVGGKAKIPLMISAGIHGNESEGIDATLMLIERLATTPYGADPLVDDVLNHSILVINVIQNPDGHILNQRANGNNFDLNRDW